MFRPTHPPHPARRRWLAGAGAALLTGASSALQTVSAQPRPQPGAQPAPSKAPPAQASPLLMRAIPSSGELLPRVGLGNIFRGVWSFVLVQVIMLAILVAFPQLSLWLPSFMK